MSDEPESSKDVAAVVVPSFDLSKFVLESVLNNATERKTICCLGRFTDRAPDDRAIVLFEKTAFVEAELQSTTDDKGNGDQAAPGSATYFSSATRMRELFVNDIYANFECFPSPDVNRVKTTIICPASDHHIDKYSTNEVFLFDETITDYKTKTLPYILAEQQSLNWVYNILDHRSETDRIVFEDPCEQNGFVLLPDLKWDGQNVRTLYLLAIVRRRDLRSLRDLTGVDLPLLRNILRTGTREIWKRYGVPANRQRVYLHYQPSFYHLHVHFTYLQNEAPGIRCERGHLLSTVIDNLHLMSDYYQLATLPFTTTRQHPLYAKYALEPDNGKKSANDDDGPAEKRAKLTGELVAATDAVDQQA